jgi:hypothetical protein
LNPKLMVKVNAVSEPHQVGLTIKRHRGGRMRLCDASN